MTAPDQPGLRNPVTQPTSGNDLRDRIATAIATEHHRRAQARIEASPEEHAAGFADAVMAVVQPMLDAKDAEIERITQIANVMSGLHRSAEQDAIDQRQRAEAAEGELRDQNGDHT